jgi:hypothetical protein
MVYETKKKCTWKIAHCTFVQYNEMLKIHSINLVDVSQGFKVKEF